MYWRNWACENFLIFFGLLYIYIFFFFSEHEIAMSKCKKLSSPFFLWQDTIPAAWSDESNLGHVLSFPCCLLGKRCSDMRFTAPAPCLILFPNMLGDSQTCYRWHVSRQAVSMSKSSFTVFIYRWKTLDHWYTHTPYILWALFFWLASPVHTHLLLRQFALARWSAGCCPGGDVAQGDRLGQHN